MHELTIRARRLDPDAVVWRGDVGLDPSQRGIKVLGSPIGSDEFVIAQLHATVTEHASLFQGIPAVKDLQSAWLLLLFRAVPQSQFPPPDWCDLACLRSSSKPMTTLCGSVSVSWWASPEIQHTREGQLESQ